MGSTGSRPRLCKVAPCKSLQEDGEQLKPQWTFPALPVTMKQPSGSQRHKTTLPPLKQEITLSTLSGSYPQKQSNNPSIIHAHPPRRPQALQPPALQIGHTSTANQIMMTRDCRGGGVQQFYTNGRTGHTGTSRLIQGAFLEAQAALSQHTHQQRQARVRQGRELRRHKVIYTVNGSQSTRGVQRLKLVRRPTERDVFLDETTGERMDRSCLLQPKPLPLLCQDTQGNKPNRRLLYKTGNEVQRDQERSPKKRQELKTVHQTGHREWICDKTLSWTTERETLRAEDGGKAQRGGWMWSEPDKGGQRIRGARGICDLNLDQKTSNLRGHITAINY